MAHPDKNSFCNALADAYEKDAKKNSNFKRLDLSDLKFNLNLKFGYHKKMKLEPDLQKSQKLIKWADHLVFVFPTWWASLPALLKGFIDRVFLPGFAFKYTGKISWKKFLKGKSARLIVTMGAPVWYYKWIMCSPGVKLVKNGTLKFCGISPVKTTLIGGVNKGFKDGKKWIDKIRKLGEKLN